MIDTSITSLSREDSSCGGAAAAAAAGLAASTPESDSRGGESGWRREMGERSPLEEGLLSVSSDASMPESLMLSLTAGKMR